MNPTFLLLLALVSLLGAGEALGVGSHTNLETSRPGVRYSLRIPAIYGETTRALPLLYSFGNADSPPVGSAEDWAEANGLICVRMQGVVEAKSQAELELAAAAVTAGIDKNGVRIHPFLRYSFGFSAGGMAAAAIARADAKRFSGVALLAHSGNGVMVPKNIAVAFYAGRNDTTHRYSTITHTADTYRAQGNLVRLVSHDGGHEGAPGSVYVDLLDWLLLSTCLANPALSADDRAAGVALVDKRITALATVEDLAARIATCRTMLEVPGIAASTSGKTLRSLWAASAVAGADAQAADPVAAHNLLVDVMSEPLMAQFEDKALRATIKERMTALRKDKPVTQDWSARQAVVGLQAREAKATSKGAIKDMAEAYAAIAKRYPDSPWGGKAKQAAEAWAGKMK